MDDKVQKLVQEIMLSTGTHRKRRLLSPVEVGTRLQELQKIGHKKEDIAQMVNLDQSMIEKFINLLKLNHDIKHLVDWGHSSESSISFSGASAMASLETGDQLLMSKAILQHQLTKKEIQEVVELGKKTDKDMFSRIDELLKRRPTVLRRYVFIGSITDEKVIEKLSVMEQIERDTLLLNVLRPKLFTGTKWSGRLGEKKVSLVGDRIFAQQVDQFVPHFEEHINRLLAEELSK